MQTSVMLCAPLDTPACGISRDEKALGNVDLSILRSLGRSRIPLDDYLLMNVKAQYATAKLIVWLRMDEADLNRNPYAIDFINTDLTLAPANFEENVLAAQRLQFFRWIELTFGCFFETLLKLRTNQRFLVWIPAAVLRGLDGSHESLYS